MATQRGDKVNFVRARIAEGITDTAEIIRLAKREGLKLNPSSVYSERAVAGVGKKPKSNGHATTRTQEPTAPLQSAQGSSQLAEQFVNFVRFIVQAEIREALRTERESLINRIAGVDTRQLTIPHS